MIPAFLVLAAATFTLPEGVTELDRPLAVPEGTRVIRGSPKGSTLKASGRFQGRALVDLRAASGILIRDFAIDGNRAALERALGIAPHDRSFVSFYPNNGIVVEESSSIRMHGLRIRNVAGFAVLVSNSRDVAIEGIEIADSGGRNEKGRNNTSGGILFEEGTLDFAVRHSSFRNVLGNGVWTHALYTSPRNERGWIEYNSFDTIGRDAIQVGHASRVRVAHNKGTRIGFPSDVVDVENQGIPVAIDTAGNVEGSAYTANRFTEINGKCIDLDGFHHGEVSENTCINRGRPEEYPFGHYGIVFNNTNPDMQSEAIAVTNNHIEGTKFGGIFVIGSGHRITGNRLLNLNTAHCNERHADFGCIYDLRRPDLLRAGIYLGDKAERPAKTRANVVSGNVITGFGMAKNCVVTGPGVTRKQNTIKNNRCSNR